MPTLYVTEPGAVVRRRAGSLVVTVDADRASSTISETENATLLMEFEPCRLEMIALVGRVHITSEATRLSLDQGIAVSWLSRSGKLLGRMVPELSRTADLRLHQFRMTEDHTAAMILCRAFIDAKLANASAVLSSIRSNRPGEPRFSAAISHLHGVRKRVAVAKDRDSLLGFEGEGASRYFSAFGLAFSGDIGFEVRRRRPPPDPANALLSLGYVLLANLITGTLEARGFDPYAGFLHTPRSGRPGLALDLIEEFRHPVVDRFVLRLCNRRQFRPTCFEADRGTSGLRLTRAGLRRFFREWEACLDARMVGLAEHLSVEQVIQRQVDRLASHVRGRDAYQPVLLRG